MKRHPFDAVSFVLGLVVTGIGVAFLIGIHTSTWVIPTLIGGAGLVFITAAIRQMTSKPAE